MKTEEVGRRLDLLTRRERARLIAGLVAQLGREHLELAEDVAQAALLAALSLWPYRGIPDHPAAWLATVARNKAIDRLRRAGRERPYDAALDAREDGEQIETAENELELVYLSCHSSLGELDRLTLTLRIVSGFTAREIAQIFLTSEAATAQRLSRAKRKLRTINPGSDLTAFERHARQPSALKVVYLMFSVGYAPRSGDRLIRRDLIEEALRLIEALEARAPEDGDIHALAALLCFQASRLDAREDAAGNPILLADQDRSRWNRALIRKGLGHLDASRGSAQPSRYHIEAGIAAAHATAPSFEACDWGTIVRYYDVLETAVRSPVVTINACVARAFAGAPEAALAVLDTLAADVTLRDYTPLHIARAEIAHLLGRHADAAECFERALEAGASAPVLRHLQARLVSTL